MDTRRGIDIYRSKEDKFNLRKPDRDSQSSQAILVLVDTGYSSNQKEGKSKK